MSGQALIVQGDALHLPLPDGSIDLVVSSPPYWALRSYSAGPGEIGSEPTPAQYLEALWAATAEMMRVLKPTGSIFVDLGDKYSGNETGGALAPSGSTLNSPANVWKQQTRRTPARTGLRPKSLLLLPERYRVGCVDRLGLIARAVLVWNKPNGLPESVTDRVRRSHEDWVHLVKQPRYYSATDEVREPQAGPTHARGGTKRSSVDEAGLQRNTAGAWNDMPPTSNPLGKLPGSVWSIPSEPLRLPEHLGVQHYAAFPSEWPRRLILGWSPPGICLECGQGRVPVVDRGGIDPELLARRGGHADLSYSLANHHGGDPTKRGIGLNVSGKERQEHSTPATILGYACSCTPFTDHPGTGEPAGPHGLPGQDYRAQDSHPNVGQGWEPSASGKGGLGDRPKVGPWREYHLDGWKPPPTRPAVVLDPFSGTGTTAMVARALGRIGVGVDLSFDYCRAARWRVWNDGAKAISRTNLERQGSLL